MTGTVLVYDPTAPAARVEVLASGKVTDLRGATVGFVDNAKPNFDHLVEDLAHLLRESHGVARIVNYRKRGPSMPAVGEDFDDLIRECDIVVAGSGD